MKVDQTYRLAQAVREACVRVALDAYEQAGLGGLCSEGRWEMAIDAIRALDLASVVETPQALERENMK